MTERTLAVSVGGSQSVTAIVTEPLEPATGWQLIYAPGAGSNVHDPFGRFLCGELAAKGILCGRFQFPYQEAGRRTPDRPAVLEETWRCAIRALRSPGLRLALSGRSMGGRIASLIIAQGERVDALVLFAYPLHPPGKPDLRRIEHLPRVVAPTLFCSGTGDAFASADELQEAARLVPSARVHLMACADHGFGAPRASGRTKQDVYREAAGAAWEWLREVH